MKANLQKFLTRKFVPLVNDIIFSAQNDEQFFYKQTGFSDYVKNMEVIDDAFYFDTDWMDGIQKKYQAEPIEKFNIYLQNAYTHAEKLLSFARELKNNSTTLEEQCTTSISLLRNLLAFLPVTHPLAKTIEARAIPILKDKGVSQENMETVLLDITAPSKLNAPILEQHALYTIAVQMNTPGFDLEHALDKHVEQFAFLGYREPFAAGYEKDFFRSRLSDMLANPPTHPTPTQSFSFTNEEQEVIDLMKEFVYFRNYRTEKLYEALYYIEPLWMDIAKKYELSDPHDIAYYLMREINDLLSSHTKVNNATIAARKIGFAILLHENNWFYYAGNEVGALKAEKESGVSKSTTLKGTPACKGIIKGRARIVLSASEQNKIQPGDILITHMTTPDFLPCMKKAAGFVTDEGGITCHAAIVAREMNKPCIIGTKNATTSFKDGDMIEVNAMTGIVQLV